MADPLHQDWNGLKKAAVDAGMWLPLLERCVVANLPSGPFQGHAFHQVIRSSASHFFQTSDESNPLFQHMFPKLASDFDLHALDQGSAEHQKAVWERCKLCDFLHKKGARVRMGRWYALFHAIAESKGEMTCLLMVLIYVGLKEGYWKALTDSPLFKTTAGISKGKGKGKNMENATHMIAQPTDDAVATGVGGSSTDVMPRTVRESNEEVKKLRARGKSTLHFSALLLGQHKHMRLVEAASYLAEPFRRTFGLWETMLKTQMGSMQLHFDWALLVGVKECCEAIALLNGGAAFHRLSFHTTVEVEGEDLMNEDEEIALSMVEFLVGLLEMRMTTALQYHIGVPGMLVCLLHTDGDIVRHTLKTCQQLWDVLASSEKKAATDNFARLILKSLMWPQWIWAREVFIQLSEAKFLAVPLVVDAALKHLFHGVLSTQITEEAHNVLREAATKSPSGALGAERRWSALQQSALLEEYDYPKRPPMPPHVVASMASSLPKSCFEPKRDFFSQGVEHLRTMTSDPSWQSVSPEGWNLIPFFHLACISLQGDWQKLHGLWRSLLLDTCVCIRHIASKRMWLTVKVTRWGVLAWRLNTVRVSANVGVLMLQSEHEHGLKPWEVLHITDVTEYDVGKVHAAPPADPLNVQAGYAGVTLRLKSGMKSLFELAATQGFKNMTKPYLELAMKEQELTIPRGATEAFMLKALVVHCLPLLPEEDVMAICDSRSKRKHQDATSILQTEEVADAFAHVIPEEDEDVYRKSAVVLLPRPTHDVSEPGGVDAVTTDRDDAEVVQAELHQEEVDALVQPPRSSNGAASSGSGPSRHRIPTGHVHTPEELKRFMPTGPGRYISFDDVLHNRYKVQMKCRPEGQKVCSKSWNDGTSERECLLICLRFAWDVERELTGAACPYDLSS
eukprot:853390-Amphidinium_carterae.1